MPIECTVKYSCGSYITSTVRGKRCSCSHSPDEAVRRLGVKLLGKSFSHVERVPEPGPHRCDVSTWLIVEKEV